MAAVVGAGGRRVHDEVLLPALVPVHVRLQLVLPGELLAALQTRVWLLP